MCITFGKGRRIKELNTQKMPVQKQYCEILPLILNKQTITVVLHVSRLITLFVGSCNRSWTKNLAMYVCNFCLRSTLPDFSSNSNSNSNSDSNVNLSFRWIAKFPSYYETFLWLNFFLHQTNLHKKKILNKSYTWINSVRTEYHSGWLGIGLFVQI